MPIGLAGGICLAAVGAAAQGLASGFDQVSPLSLAILFACGSLATLYGYRLLRRRLAEQRRALERGFSDRTADLVRTEKRFAEYGEAASEWFWETDAENRFAFLSSRLYEVSGVRPEDVLGRRRESMWAAPENDEERATWATYRQCIENRLPFDNLRYRSRIANGRELLVCLSGKPFFDEDGSFLGYRGTARDATGEVREERRRQAEQALIYNATAVLPDGFFIFDADDRLMMCNERFREIYSSVADLIEPGVPYEKLLREIADRQLLFDDEQHKRDWVESTLAAHANPTAPFEESHAGGQWIRVIEQRMPDGNLVGLCVDVTPIKRIEEELAEAQRMSNSGSYRMDFTSGRMISASPQLLKICGIDEAALLEGDDPRRYGLVHPEDLERVKSAYEAAQLAAPSAAGDLVFEIEYRIHRADGELRHIVERTGASKVDNGRITELIGTLQDVTELRQIERELEAAQKIARVGSFRWDTRRDQPTSFSAEISNICGRTPEQIRAFSDEEFAAVVIHPEDRERVLAAYAEAEERCESYAVEYRIVRPDGEVRHVIERAEVSDRHGGRIHEYLGMFQDVTEEKLVELELATAQAIAQVGSFRWDVENQRMVSYSNEYLRIMGRSAEQMDALGLEGLIGQIVHPDDRERVQAVFSRSQTHDEPYQIEYRILRPDGECRFISERCETSVRREGRPVEQVGALQDVTGLRQFERELEDAQRMARIGSFRWDVEEEKLISCSREYLEIYGRSREFLMKLPVDRFHELVHAEDLERLSAAHAHIDRTGENIEIEYRLLRPNGEIRRVIERLGVAQWRDGRPVEQIGTLQDVTERRLFEHQLEEAQRIAGVGSFRFSLQEQRDISVTPELARIYGRSIEELLSFDVRELIQNTVHAADRARLVECYARADENGEKYQVEYRLLRPDGEVRKVIERAEPLLTRDGKVVELLGTLQDVTERVRDEERRRVSDEMLEAAIENVPGGFLLVDTGGRIERFNRRFCDLYPEQRPLIAAGVTLERFLQCGLEQGVYVDAVDDPEAWKQERLDLRGRDLAEFIERMNDGRSIQVAARRLPNGSIVSMHVDVSELERAREEAERANAAKSDFLASMSHELRTPMHAILSFADLGIRRVERLSQEKLVQYLENIRSSGNRLLFLLNDLLDLSKLEAGKMRLDVAPLNLAELIQSCIDEQALRLRDSRLSCVLFTDLPGTGCSGDGNRIYQVISNVVSNAIKFSPEGGRIEIRLDRAGSYYRVEVVDEGIGIPEGDLDQIFDKFYQSARSRRRSGDGTGLGLAICREIVDLHGGRIWAENNPGPGSRFVIELPAESGLR